MNDDGIDGGILNIALASDSESEDLPLASAPGTTKSSNGTTVSSTADKKAKRTEQTEEAFQAVKKSYAAKVENGDLYKSVALPLPPDANKHHSQELLHAVEELYFFRRFSEAVDFVQTVLDAEPETGGGLDNDTKATLVGYQQKCQQRLDQTP
jgi:hypothetical protein